ncbi:helix-turn-helix transcriptional regulator [Bradyrhizobium sp. RT10b]|uniref:helix-turn-helix transcriptional regulator n=1 Tax=Bradyrhizobium sp. RT10b TaxID=3156331 RepID=UPI003396CB24
MTSSPTSRSPQNLIAARFVGDVREELISAFLEEMAERGLSKSEVARLLDVNRSVVSRILNGTAPLELRTIGQLAWAMGRDPQFKLPKRKKKTRGANHVGRTNAPQAPFGRNFVTVETP